MAVLSLAIGIGPNTAIFSLLYQVVFRSLPIRDPDKVVFLESDEYNYGWTLSDNNKSVFSYPMYRELRDHNQVFSGLIGRASFPAVLTYHGSTARTLAEVVTGNFFEVLGTRASLGRLLIPSDDSLQAVDLAVVLSHSFWVSHLGGDPTVLNGKVLVNSKPATIVGVAPQGFRSLLPGQTPDLFVPVSMMSIISPGWQMNEQVDAYWLNLFGRLRPGVSERQANSLLLPLFRSLLRAQLPQMTGIGEEPRKKILAKTLVVRLATQGLSRLRDQWQTPLLVLMVMVGLVLLIACANVANLLVARAAARQREIAVRLAIGATTWQIARQLIVESALLALAGGLLGLLLSVNLTEGLLSLLPTDTAGGWLTAQFDFGLLGFSLALSLITGVLFGLLPVLQATRPQLVPALKEQSAGLSTGGRQSQTRQGFVVTQITISILLLIGAGLFSRSLLNLIHTETGFRTDHLITFSIDPSLSGYTRQQAFQLSTELQERLRRLPGVRSATRSLLLPLGGSGWGNGVKVPGSRNASQEYIGCNADSVGSDYFSTLGIPLMAGREFNPRDTSSSAKVAIINETFAHFLFGNENPLGKHMLIGSNDANVEIVGVVKDSKHNDLREKPGRLLYVPYEQGFDNFTQQAVFLIRSQGDVQNLMAAVQTAVKQVDANLPITRLTSMEVIVSDSIYTERLIAMLAIGFGVTATLLAAVGLYGTLSYSVIRRTREFGIRLVLGAIPGRLLLYIMRDVGRMTIIGMAVGLPVSYVLSRLVESQLFAINAHDPWVLGGASLLIVIVAVLAALLPAIRAMKIEPVRALRYE